ncbi:ATP-binding protein [Anaerosporobacter faecicola]|uniref:ATP-binding protein n=1 Tax=Anaerosporobacter faecicola TaxID=2718714 RepID=UPI00143C6848|nr:sensor histidine kinase [Anaerosporobacter faecicola]
MIDPVSREEGVVMKSFRFIDYMKLRVTFFLLLFLSGFLFPFLQYLYGYRVEAAWYCVEIELFLSIVIVVIDFRLQKNKYIKLQQRLENVSVYETETYVPSTCLEQEYEQIISALYEKAKECSDQMEMRYKGQIEYFTMWVHQIKTPIAALSLLLDNSDLEYSLKSAMKQEVFKIEQYASIVLEYLRIDNMSNDFILSPYDLEKIVKKVVKKYATIFIHEKNTLVMDNLEVSVQTDERWLAFLIEQILSNALKYTKEGTIHIYSEKDYINRTVLVIEDTGIGIKEEDIPRIFEKGYTGLNGRMNQKATGIGLYLCKKVADRLSCSISVESKVREGTKVSIFFPKENLEIF